MILKEEVFPIGQITKPHGVNGEMSFNFTTDVFDSEDVDFFIMELNGILVPFFIEDYRFKSNSTGLVKLSGVNSDEQAREFSGSTLFVSKDFLEKVEDTEIELDYFVGFQLIDKAKGSLGIVTEVDQTTENALFVIPTDDDELLIPVGENYIEKIDHDKKIIYLNLPEGLLEI